MKKHPGLWFFLWCMEVTFLLPTVFGYLNFHPFVELSVKMILFGLMIYGMTYYHGKWVEHKFQK